ncbi:phenylalanine--tRNA ligase subunit beta [Paroceanicella profunda]|uniref:Phenylalanine--tRNA ligase beta subunit n=1 Tax=Paroceanicella profunda TaxID=2579971 RepID=A0A5B8G0R6_9RHOB|nr:phenylalanine--tRNA ligase subunit beta [Paroceanicella profunda]QDL92729.1 phenylalanine--tRNA ligase subunit beta [Paroceanicella profunda]
MKFTLSWLKQHLETEASLEEITYALTDLGLEVEGVEDPGARLAAFRIGFVREAEQHPDADRLRVCKVETAEGVKQIICGAPNARAGIRVVVAQPGDYIPGLDTTIAVGKIRGVESFGMMCSERELELSEEHDGIIELPEDAEVGQRYVDYAQLTDPVIEIAITPNRPDALGVAGIARDLAARGLGRLITQAPEPVPGRFASPVGVSIAPSAAAQCPLFLGRAIRGVKNGPSPKWLQDRLRAIGLRPISALVDITNYMTMDRARPLHVFDMKTVAGDILVRKAEPGETLTALDGRVHTFDGTETLVCDANGPSSIGGIMGGEGSGCEPDTTDVFIEAAWFEPVSTAATGRRLKINSDARYRFERGVDPEFTRPGLEMATRLILDLCGGEPSDIVTAGAVPDTARSFALDPKRVLSLVGMDIAEEEQVRTLEVLGFTVTRAEGKLHAAVPPWRPDVHGEADLVEEIARVASLSKLEGKPMPRVTTGVTRPTLTPMQMRERRARRTLAMLGLNECVTYTFVSDTEAALFGGGEPARRLENPISSEMTNMRPSLLPALLSAAARNQARGHGEIGLFEIGPLFEGGEPGEQKLVAAAIRTGVTAPRNAWGSRRPVDLFDAKADAEAVLSACGAPVERLMVLREGLPSWYHPGRSACLSLGPKTPLAMFGELHPKVLSTLGVKAPAVALTVFLENIPFPRAKGTTRPALDVSDYQAVERDFAFVLDEGVEAEAVLKAARGADKALIERVSVFDLFTGKPAAEQLGAGRKSLAISVRLQPKSGTLTDKEIDAVAAKVVAAVTKATGGTLRG